MGLMNVCATEYTDQIILHGIFYHYDITVVL